MDIRSVPRRILRRPGAILLVVLCGLLPLRAWASDGDDRVEVDRETDGLRSVTWTGAVAPDGRIAVRIHYDLDETERTFDLRVPPGSRYLAVDGVAVAADSGRYATVEIDGPVTVTYELVGRVDRYRDGALVTIAGTYGDAEDATLQGDFGLFFCPRCSFDPIGYGDTAVFGALYAPGASSGEILFNGLDPVRRDTPPDDRDNPDAISFLGSDVGTDDVSMLAVIPASAVPDVARSDGDVAAALTRFQERFDSSDDRFRLAEPVEDAPDRTPAWILTALFALLLAVLVGGPWWANRQRRQPDGAVDGRAPGGEVPRLSGSNRPNDLSPAMAALVSNHAIDRKQSFVAATILDLARRRVITISGVDNRRFRIEIPAQPSGLTAFERAVVTQMRPLGVEPDPPKETEIVGPPVWHGRAPFVVRSLGRAVVKEGIRTKVIRRNRIPLLIVPIVIAMGVVALRSFDGFTLLAWTVMTLGSLIGLVTAVRAGTPLTAYGREQRAIWNDYAAWLRSDRELEHADVSDIEILGESLVYGAALGAAPKVARALSPMPNGPT